MSYAADSLEPVVHADRLARQRPKRYAPRVREYDRLTAAYAPLVEAAKDQPNPSPALIAALEVVTRDLGCYEDWHKRRRAIQQREQRAKDAKRGPR